MDWLKLGTNLADHPRVLRLSDHAFRAYITALCYAARHETDGVVLVAEDDREAFGELLTVGLGEPRNAVTNGAVMEFQLYKWNKWNPTKDRIDAARQAGRERQARFRGRNAVTNSPHNGEVTRTEVEVEVEVKEPSAAKPHKRETARPIDELFEAIAQAVGWTGENLTKDARGRVNAARAQLAKLNVEPEDVQAFAVFWEMHYPGANLTPQAITGNWPEWKAGKLDAPAGRRR